MDTKTLVVLDAPWEADGVKPLDDTAALIFVRAHDDVSAVLVGYLLVIEKRRPDAKFKMPGGHRQPGEYPTQTAARELVGETGLDLPLSAFTYVNSEWRDARPPRSLRGHWSMLFVADINEKEDVPWMSSLHRENEGEEPKFFRLAEFARLVQGDGLLRSHFVRLKEAKLIGM